MPFRPICVLLPLIAILLASCESPDIAAALEARKAAIAAETPGNYYIGRRFHIERTHFWGYLRRPRDGWDTAKLVIFNERIRSSPDRLPEDPAGGGPAYGYDHNFEYRIWGRYTGRRIFDPNSNLILPEFQLENCQLVNDQPGWLFNPKEKFNGAQLLRGEPDALPR